MRLHALIFAAAFLACTGLLARSGSWPNGAGMALAADRSPQDSLDDAPRADGPPVPPRPTPATGSSLADLIASLRARGPLAPSEEDAMLREEIIRGTNDLAMRPPIPPAVKSRFDRAFRAASRKATAEQTLRELAFVLSEAPWWPEPYLEIAKVEEKLGHLENAVVDLELYLVARPDAKDWKRVRTKLRALRLELLGPQ